jgi:hypothetical protein
MPAVDWLNGWVDKREVDKMLWSSIPIQARFTAHLAIFFISQTIKTGLYKDLQKYIQQSGNSVPED